MFESHTIEPWEKSSVSFSLNKDFDVVCILIHIACNGIFSYPNDTQPQILIIMHRYVEYALCRRRIVTNHTQLLFLVRCI